MFLTKARQETESWGCSERTMIKRREHCILTVSATRKLKLTPVVYYNNTILETPLIVVTMGALFLKPS